ncbi:MAG: tail fiber protein [Bacteroidia bacterium]
MEGYIGVVTTVAYDFSPKNWASCNGQILPIAQNQALFSILGTTFGGNGVTTFALPDFRSRTALGTGTGAGLPNTALGQVSGSENVMLSVLNLPSHAHNGNVSFRMQASNSGASEPVPDGTFINGFTNGFSNATPDTTLIAPTYVTTIGVAGSSQPIDILSPYLVINYVICLYGIFPSRN